VIERGLLAALAEIKKGPDARRTKKRAGAYRGYRVLPPEPLRKSRPLRFGPQ
jgi:hypothetical protein